MLVCLAFGYIQRSAGGNERAYPNSRDRVRMTHGPNPNSRPVPAGHLTHLKVRIFEGRTASASVSHSAAISR
jgi:hypothetical protein